MIIVLMGVTGSGKTTVGRLLAQELGWKFLEGDDFHPPQNIEKLRRGLELSDEDRAPWLDAIAAAIRATVARNESAVISCSALKASYRSKLQTDGTVEFVYLLASPALIRERLQKRAGHFMKPNLVPSQFATLEEPHAALRVDASLPPAEIVHTVKQRLQLDRPA